MKTSVQKILISSYPVYREYRLLRLTFDALRCRDREPILVYQMGKVGSTAVAGALKAACPDRLVLHLHTLKPDRLQSEERTYRRSFSSRRRIDAHLLHGLFVRRRLAGWPPRPRRRKIVTLVREPVQRNVSTFFQTMDLFFAQLGFADRIRRGDDSVLDDLERYFVESFPHERVLTWFEDEIQAVFGLDLLAERFPHERGYRIYRGPRADILLIRYEDLGQAAPPGLRELLGLEAVELARRNVGSAKYYGEVYRRFLRRIALPEPLLDRIYGSRMVQALYTEGEIATFRKRWSAS